jgi:predicted RNA methylase
VAAVEPVAQVDSLLKSLGYPRAQTERHYPVWVGNSVVSLDFVAFGSLAPHDMTTATLAVVLSRDPDAIDRAMRGAQALAAPALLAADANHVSVWPVASTDRSPVKTLPWEEWRDAGRLARELTPEYLLRSKHAGRQMGLFPIEAELLSSARQATITSLAGRVATAVKRADSMMPKAKPDAVARLVVGVVAMLMVRDKLEGEDSPKGVEALALARFPAYFDWLSSLEAQDRDVLAELLEDLGADINYRGLDPALISDVYEHALLDATARKKLSVFYTPPDVARALVSATPFELVPPEHRTVLDLACGSGTLLVSAYERLRAAAPVKFDFEQTHRYLTTHLFGFDTDPFAIEIAKLSLLLAALPIGNSWRVERRSVDEGLPDELPAIQFVLSNPPWSTSWTDRHKTDKEEQRSTRQRTEVAERFIRASLNAVVDDGYIALLLPATIFESRTSAPIRTWLDQRASAIDVVRLPEDTFTNSSVETAAVVLQKGSGRQPLYMFRRATKKPGWRDRTLVGSEPDINLAVSAQWAVREGLIAHGPLDGADVTALGSLADIAQVSGGAVPTPGFPIELRRTGRFRWLPKAGAMPFLRPVEDDELDPTTYPNGFNWRGPSTKHFLRPKVLVSGVQSPSNPWRLRVRLDLIGVIPRQSMHFVAPTAGSPADLDAVAAYMSCAPVALWVDQHNTSRSIRISTLRTLPAPTRPGFWNELSAHGARLRGSVESGDSRLTSLLRAVDDLVMDEWGLGEAEQDGVRRVLAGFSGPEGAVRYTSTPPPPKLEEEPAVLRASGTVLAVSETSIRLWVAGVTGVDGQEVAVPRSFPGALLVAGATFECEIAGGDVLNAQYRLQRHSWMSDDDLFARTN